MYYLKKKIMVLLIALVCIAPVFMGGCGGWHKAGKGSALFSAKIEILKSGEEGTETFVGDGKSIGVLQQSPKPSHEEKVIALEQEKSNRELKKQMISAGLGERVIDAMRQ